jgi:hypothetical protein
MSVSSLTRFTVPLASDVSAISQGLLMPKLAYRFRVMFENFGISTPTTELTKQVAKAARPHMANQPFVVDVYNSKINLFGKPTWQPVTISLRDDVTNSVSKLVNEQMQKQFDFLEQASAAAGCNYKFTMSVEMLDGGNGAIEPYILDRWECYGCMLNDVNFSALDYSQAGPVMIDLQIQPDNCILTNTGVVTAGSQRGTLGTCGGN